VLANQKFKVNITRSQIRLLKGVSKFLHRLDGRTGLFLEQAFVKTNEYSEAELQINCYVQEK
jgi:hexosaminidase